MIEKITPDHILGLDGLPTTIMPDSAKLMRKINELVDAVNEIMTWRFDCDDETRAENVQQDAESRPVNVQDEFAEQRKWIGKLCRFRDNPACEWKYGILYRIYENTDFPFWDTDCYEYAECEPVKPDEDIIYRGE